MRAVCRTVSVLGMFALFVWTTPAESRPWRDASGKRSFEAEFVSLVHGKVTLKRPDGKLVTVALERFSAADQQVAREHSLKIVPADEVPKVELVGLGVSKSSYAGDSLLAPGMLFNGGVTLKLVASAGDRIFVGFDEQSSRIDACTDDQGTNLANFIKDDLNYRFFGPFSSSVSDDGKYCSIVVSLPGVPAKGVNKVHFAATLAIQCGRGEQTAEQQDVPLKPGSEITVGPVPMRIDSVEGDGSRGGPLMVSFASDQPPDAIKWIDFFDAAGNVIEYSRLGAHRNGFNEEVTYSTTYVIRQNVEKVTVRITYYAEVETLAVPVKLEAGLGL